MAGVDHAHCLDDAEHGGDDAKCGQGIGERVQGTDSALAGLNQAGHRIVQARIGLGHSRRVKCHQAKTVTDHLRRVIIAQQPWIGCKQVRGFGGFDIGFDGDDAAAPGLAGQVMQGLQQIGIVVSLPTGAANGRYETAQRLADRARGIANQERAEGRPANQGQLKRQGRHDGRAAADQQAAENNSEDDEEASNLDHGQGLSGLTGLHSGTVWFRRCCRTRWSSLPLGHRARGQIMA